MNDDQSMATADRLNRLISPPHVGLMVNCIVAEHRFAAVFLSPAAAGEAGGNSDEHFRTDTSVRPVCINVCKNSLFTRYFENRAFCFIL